MTSGTVLVYKEGEHVLEIGKLTFKGGCAHLYLPASIRKGLGIDKTKDRSLILYFDESVGLLCFKDTRLETELKPKILEARVRIQELKKVEVSP
jgi:hypothetical protein